MAAVKVHKGNYTYSDVALLRLERKLDYRLGYMPICLPEVRLFHFIMIDHLLSYFIICYNL